jgi:hypothetical protein
VRHDVRRLAAVALVALSTLIAACGGSGSAAAADPAATSQSSPSASSAPSGSPSTATSPSPSAAVSGPPAPAVPGYTLEPAPADALGSFQQLAASAPDVYSSVSAYSVSKSGGKEIGGLILFGIKNGGATTPALADQLVGSIAAGLAGTGDVTTETLAGTKVVWTESGGNSASAIWFKDGVLAMVVGSSRADLTPFVTSTIKAG